MKKLTTLLLLCMVLMTAKAGEKDDFSFGIKLGGMSSNIDTEDLNLVFASKLSKLPLIGLGPEWKRLVGPQFGFIFEIPVLEYFEIRPELNFASQGVRAVNGDNVLSNWLGYVQLPIMFRGQYGNDKVRGFAHVGPQLGYGIFVFDRPKYGDKIDEDNKTSDSFSDRNWKAFDAGIAFGAGVEFPAAKGLELEVRYYKGLSDFQNNELLPSIKNNSLQFSLGVKF